MQSCVQFCDVAVMSGEISVTTGVSCCSLVEGSAALYRVAMRPQIPHIHLKILIIRVLTAGTCFTNGRMGLDSTI